ncbi:Xaa-Pro aminopeptidase [uncultured Gammaproteobacteria bacterium]
MPINDHAARIAALRTELTAMGLDGFFIPHADEYQNEYVPPNAERLAWLTGFTGSAGLAIVLANRAVVFVDGRYTLQVRGEVDGALFEIANITDQPAGEWLAAALPDGGRIGFDPWLHTIGWLEKTRAVLARSNLTLINLANNPLDRLWTTDRPPPPASVVEVYPIEYAGHSSLAKRNDLALALAAKGLATAVLTQPESIAWLLNIRGDDVPHTPLALSRALLFADGRVDWFIAANRLAIPSQLESGITVLPPEAFGAALDTLGHDQAQVLVDPAATSIWVFERLTAAGAVIDRGDDPCLLPRACKNEVELRGSRAAHCRDGVAMVRFLCWLTKELAAAAPGSGLSERAAAAKALEFRAQNALFRGLSFETISAAGANGATVHYRTSEATDRPLEPGSLYLIDSGGQYTDGTTDITRTIALGTPSAEMREHYTLVLKGHIALARARFPPGTSGGQLDCLARMPLWAAGLDYDHGTGHGVGCFLGVHEGPQRVSKVGGSAALCAGMILSNEPGYYRAGAYGIRLENLVVVQSLPAPMGAEHPLLGFETLTMVPFDRELIVSGLLGMEERAWLNDYHAQVRETLTSRLEPESAEWLAAATAPIP